MIDQHCTTDQYGNTGCIGTAVHHHDLDVLPMTGFDMIHVGLLVVGVWLLVYTGYLSWREIRRQDGHDV
jgi:hypothetical protein